MQLMQSKQLLKALMFAGVVMMVNPEIGAIFFVGLLFLLIYAK